MSRIVTTKDFINRARAIHGDKYDYSRVVYTTNRTNVEIICPTHGSFLQTPTNHLRGKGCTKCGRERTIAKQSDTKDTFVAKAVAVHGDRYDYSKVEYINNSTKICIICPEHGEFWQTPCSHLNGNGCPDCALVSRSKHRSYTTAQFVDKASVVHNHKYDYSLAEYRGAESRVKIICPIHGVFEQCASTHLQGYGCPKCAAENRKGLICGVGYNDMGIRDSKSRVYKVWQAMINRCYNEEKQKGMPTYIGCTVADEWLVYSNFYAWYTDPSNGYREGYHIDKDLFSPKGKKVYSPDTCCFLPHEINTLIKGKQTKVSALPEGVSFHHGKYFGRITKHGKCLTTKRCETPQAAFIEYAKMKEEYVYELATEYFSRGEITERVYNRLLKYKIEQ